MIWTRPDATLVRDLSTMRRFMPFISPRRNEALVYFAQEIEVDAALEYLAEKNRKREPERQMTFFHMYLHSLAMGFHERPRNNRFTAGGRLWQRDGVWLSFAAKQEMADGADLKTVKREFPAAETLDEMTDSILDRIRRRRGGERTTSDREMSLAVLLPSWLLRLVLWGLRAANNWGVLPKSMIDSDPMFCTCFVANLGSVGLDAAYHHVWEYGTCPNFAVIGRIREHPNGRRTVTVKYTYDERVEDGFYAAATLQGIKERLEDPARLDAPPRLPQA
ncbi:MAG: 2-oxo acid dehydrogenase subunit E2 [Proteobacteria bacterium]|nr:2-oxo acid dehydrogenase subunit E2 [Pseudomonadota bacterium]